MGVISGGAHPIIALPQKAPVTDVNAYRVVRGEIWEGLMLIPGRDWGWRQSKHVCRSAKKNGNFSTAVPCSNLANPVAVRYQGEKLLVLDKNNKTVLRFEPTETAQLINNAVKAHYSGDVQTASGYWKNVISDNPNYELAYQ